MSPFGTTSPLMVMAGLRVSHHHRQHHRHHHCHQFYEVGSILLLKPVTLVEVDSSSKTVISDESYMYISGQLCLVSGRIARIYLAKVFGQMAQKD